MADDDACVNLIRNGEAARFTKNKDFNAKTRLSSASNSDH